MIFGIDLGTSNSVISYLNEKGEAVVIPNSLGKLTTPSVVHFDGEKYTVGSEAKKLLRSGDENTVSSFKVDMGSAKVVTLSGKPHTPVELSAQVLKYLKECAEEYTGMKVEKVVITVPAYFNEIQRKCTREAGELAGLEVARIINEPTASSLAYGLDLKEDKTVLVYDLGGGTFDVSILNISNDVVEVISSLGDNKLGGDDFDEELAKTILRTLIKNEKYTPSNSRARTVIRELARMAKEALTDEEAVEIDISALAKVDPEFKNKSGSITLTRENFETIIFPYIQRTLEIMVKAIRTADISIKDIDEVILVGGSTKSPSIKKSIETASKMKVIQKEINPDLAVSIGATIQGSILTGDTTDMVLLDVTPFNLSVGLANGLTSTVIKANSTIPIEGRKVYTTNRDNQERIHLQIFQGNKPIAAENAILGEITLEGINPAPAGLPQIEVTFKLNENGELEVIAMDIETFKKISIKREVTLK